MLSTVYYTHDSGTRVDIRRSLIPLIFTSRSFVVAVIGISSSIWLCVCDIVFNCDDWLWWRWLFENFGIGVCSVVNFGYWKDK